MSDGTIAVVKEGTLQFMRDRKDKVKVNFERVSPFSGDTHYMVLEVSPHDYYNWAYTNTFIQKAFPYLTPDEREFLKTGITAAEWDDMFKEENDVDEA